MLSRFLLLSFLAFGTSLANAQPDVAKQFSAYGCIPAWVGVASNWQHEKPQVHFYPPSQYPGHADFVSRGLNTGITFSQFKQQVSHPQSRNYLPFFVYDLRKKPLTIEGKLCHWVLHVEDYSYSDSPEEMAQSVLKLLEVLESELIGFGAGAVVLSRNAEGRPNVRIAPRLSKAGYSNVTTTQLVQHFGGAQIQVLNAGKSYGYLRLVPAGKENSFRPQARDIVIYEQLPKRLFPVSGIISLEPQHELSHINLLAKNRRTVNLSLLELDALPNAVSLQGKLVQLVCERGKVMLVPANEKEAERFWSSQKKSLQIPKPLFDQKSIVVLGQSTEPAHQLRYIGSKAHNYHWLLTQPSAQKKVKVGKALALPFAYYKDFMVSNGIDGLVKELLSETNTSEEELEKQLKQLRKRIENGSIEKGWAKTLKKKVAEHMGVARVRLRSSTNCEDLPNFNGAGLYVSKGFDTTDSYQKLERKIKEVFASLWTPEAFEERSYFGIDHHDVAMAVLISPAYPTEYANGVLMSLPSKSQINFLVNSQFANHSVSNPEGEARSELLLFNKDGALVTTKEASSIHPIFLDTRLREAQKALLETALELHNSFTQDYTGYGIDIEFKIQYEAGNYTVYLKQIRLIGHVLPE